MAIYVKPPQKDEAYKLLATAMKKWHPFLAAEEVTVGILYACPGENDEKGVPVLKLHGYTCAATVKVISYKLRVQGLEDALITIDESTWKSLSDAEKLAVIDHELTHLTTVPDKYGGIKRDDIGRPKLKIRLHDWQLGGFREICERHKEAALEKQGINQLLENYGQQLSLFPDDQAA